jgi:hypothetical protein
MKAGVKTQDSFDWEINGQPVNVRFPRKSRPRGRKSPALPIGGDVTLSIRRGKETMSLTGQDAEMEGGGSARRRNSRPGA